MLLFERLCAAPIVMHPPRPSVRRQLPAFNSIFSFFCTAPILLCACDLQTDGRKMEGDEGEEEEDEEGDQTHGSLK